MNKYPVVIFSILFSLGIAVSPFLHLSIFTLFIYLILLITLLLLNYFFSRKEIVGLLLTAWIFTGVFLTGKFYYTAPADFVYKKELHKEEVKLFGIIEDINIGSKDEYRFKVSSDSILYMNKTILYEGKFDCVIRNDSGSLSISPGNEITITGVFFRGKDIRNPGEFDYENYLLNSGITGYIYAPGLTIRSYEINVFRNVIYKTREYLTEGIDRYHDKKTASLLKGLLLGEKSDINRDIRTDFINTGTAHILAVSGLHVGYIILIFIFITGRMNLYLRALLTALGIILFVFISGTSPSVLRAAIMALVVITAFITNRSANIYNSLAVSALVILAADPSQIFLPGFQLSYAAVISIAVLYPLFRDKINSIHFRYAIIKKVILFSAVSLAAQIGTLPFVLYYFSKLSVVALFTNMFIVPIAGFIVGTAFVSLLFIPVFPVLGAVFASSNIFLCSMLFSIINFTGNPLFSFLWIQDFTIIDGFIYYICLALLFIFYLKSTKLLTKILFPVMIFILFFISVSLDNKQFPGEGNLYCYMIDVGQGDAILIKFPSGKTALIDAGETTMNYDSGEKIIEPLLIYSGINKIDYAFVSHLDNDHYSGFVHLIKEGYIDFLYKPYPDTTVKEFKFEKFLNDCNVKFSYYNEEILDVDNVRVYFLKNKQIIKSSLSNDLSSVIYVCYGNTGFLFTGDAGYKAEREYIARYKYFLRSDVLKVSHHGSGSATSTEFLNYVSPKISLISAGEKNKFGHPSDKTLARLRKVNSKIYRTDEEGGILLQSDGNVVTKINWREPGEIYE